MEAPTLSLEELTFRPHRFRNYPRFKLPEQCPCRHKHVGHDKRNGENLCAKSRVYVFVKTICSPFLQGQGIINNITRHFHPLPASNSHSIHLNSSMPSFPRHNMSAGFNTPQTHQILKVMCQKKKDYTPSTADTHAQLCVFKLHSKLVMYLSQEMALKLYLCS